MHCLQEYADIFFSFFLYRYERISVSPLLVVKEKLFVEQDSRSSQITHSSDYLELFQLLEVEKPSLGISFSQTNVWFSNSLNIKLIKTWFCEKRKMIWIAIESVHCPLVHNLPRADPSVYMSFTLQ